MQNVVLLTIDALRADHLSSYGYHRGTTSFLDELAERGVRFTSAYSPSSHTREAVPALLSGKHPHEATDGSYSLAAPSIPELLPERYATAAFHSNPFLSQSYGFEAGFDKFDDDLYIGGLRILALAQRFLDKLRNRHYANAETINERAMNWLASVGDEQYFLWNHYMDVHGPYDPPAEYEDLYTSIKVTPKRAKQLYHRATRKPGTLTEEERLLLIDHYDAELRYLDDQLRQFVSDLEGGGFLEDTLLIITSDHGDAFGEHGFYGHPRRLFKELLDVPMIMVAPDIPSKDVEVPVSLIDIVPTILTMVASRDWSGPGVPLEHIWNNDKQSGERVVLSETRDENKTVWRLRATNGHQSKKVEFPTNSSDLKLVPSCENRLATALRREAEAITSTCTSSKEGEENPKDLSHRLEALGYR